MFAPQAIVKAISENPDTALKELRLANQVSTHSHTHTHTHTHTHSILQGVPGLKETLPDILKRTKL